MRTEVTVPKLSATMEEAVLSRWCRQVGDAIKEGDVLLELETDKATLEVEATASGTLSEIRAEQGETVAVGAVIAILGDGAGATAALAKDALPPSAPRLKAATASGLVAVTGTTAMQLLGRPARFEKRAVRATPLARRLAAEHGISLEGLKGTGPRDRISRRDIEQARTNLAPRTDSRPVQASVTKPPSPVSPQGSDASAVSRMRQAVAAQVTESRRTIPSFVLDRWVDLEMLEDARALFNRRLPSEDKLTITDLILQSIADVLAQHPLMLQVWSDGPPPALSQADAGALGLVVGLDEGVMIPVLKGLGGAGLSDIARQRREAMAAVRAGRLGAAFSGKPALSVSNIGKVGVDRFEAIISPGETAILAIGRVHERAVVVSGGVKAALGAQFTLSVDHRVIDGLVGGRFLGALADRIERQTWRL